MNWLKFYNEIWYKNYKKRIKEHQTIIENAMNKMLKKQGIDAKLKFEPMKEKVLK